jgi:Zn-dependent peptidase ImmA (M78 family)
LQIDTRGTVTASNKAIVEGRMLLWARNTTHTPQEVAAKAVAVPVQQLDDWENGREQPTIRQLRLLAKKYRFPLAVFFLPEPPDYSIPHVRDFRSLEKQEYPHFENLMTQEVRLSSERREILLELQSEAWDVKLPQGISVDDSPAQVGAQLREALFITIEQQSRWRTEGAGFRSLRDLVERTGTLVFQTSEVDLSILRGYSLNLSPLPVIVVNRKDAYAGRSFTILHELAHLCLRTSAVCDLSTRHLPDGVEKRTEIFCNAVAAETLVPSQDFLSQPLVQNRGSRPWDDAEIESLSRRYASSREVVVRKLLDNGLVTKAFYELKRKQYKEEFETAKSKEGGPIRPAVNATSLLGKMYVETLFSALDQGRITLNDFSDYANVKLKHLDEMRSLA